MMKLQQAKEEAHRIAYEQEQLELGPEEVEGEEVTVENPMNQTTANNGTSNDNLGLDRSSEVSSGRRSSTKRLSKYGHHDHPHYEEEEETGWLYVVPHYLRKHRLLPRYRYEHRANAKITAPNKLFHYLSTVAFNLGWVISYFVLMVSCFLSVC